ncbi:PREDICTED: uncharacterized protein LOC105455982 isoform X2 [Wasmannia auropunctata]|uniref:uncharacterized protein LOC105455982 isoform X2 n=1 Tax=Wasmannia auropunctata TaxID=64793 RepID=UPI0005EDD860|nr:PREDICTED: uncharacterized protein LOC105455982 isoform X2 [Wasmannia auropunctata]
MTTVQGLHAPSAIQLIPKRYVTSEKMNMRGCIKSCQGQSENGSSASELNVFKDRVLQNIRKAYTGMTSRM